VGVEIYLPEVGAERAMDLEYAQALIGALAAPETSDPIRDLAA